MPGQARRGDERGGVLLNVVVAGQPLEPTADGGERAGRGGLGEAAVVESAEEGTDVGVLDAGDVKAGMVADEPGSEAAQLTAVGAESVRRCAAFGGEDVEVCVDERGGFWGVDFRGVDFGGVDFGGGGRCRKWQIRGRAIPGPKSRDLGHPSFVPGVGRSGGGRSGGCGHGVFSPEARGSILGSTRCGPGPGPSGEASREEGSAAESAAESMIRRAPRG
jgi:hypothetical protein